MHFLCPGLQCLRNGCSDSQLHHSDIIEHKVRTLLCTTGHRYSAVQRPTYILACSRKMSSHFLRPFLIFDAHICGRLLLPDLSLPLQTSADVRSSIVCFASHVVQHEAAQIHTHRASWPQNRVLVVTGAVEYL